MYFFKAVFNKIIKFMTFLTHVFKETKKIRFSQQNSK